MRKWLNLLALLAVLPLLLLRFLSSGGIEVPHGSSLRFDGVDDRMEMTTNDPDTGIYCPNGNWTADCWIKLADADLTNDPAIVAKRDGTGNTCPWQFLLTNSDNNWTYSHCYNTLWEDVKSGVAIDFDVWQYLAITVTGTTVKFYKNGDSISTQTAVRQMDITKAGDVTVARHNHNNQYYKGAMYFVRVWARTLPSTEIKYNYNHYGKVCNNDSLQLWYEFSAYNSGDTIVDKSGTDYKPLIATGRIYGMYLRNGLYFDPPTDQINVGQIVAMRCSLITIECLFAPHTTQNAWAKPITAGQDSYGIGNPGGVYWYFGVYVNGTWEKVHDNVALSNYNFDSLFFTGTYDGDKAILYKNGVKIDSTTGLGAIIDTTRVTGLKIGGEDAGDEDYRGGIMQVRIFERALDSIEVKWNVAHPDTMQDTTSLKIWYNLADKGLYAADSVYDKSLHELNAPISGFVKPLSGWYVVTPVVVGKPK